MIENRVKRVPGVASIAVGLLSEQADIKFDPALTNADDLVKVIEDAGFSAHVIETAKENSVTLKIEGMTCASCVNTIEVRLPLRCSLPPLSHPAIQCSAICPIMLCLIRRESFWSARVW
jgi:copper chaperone CopZ